MSAMVSAYLDTTPATVEPPKKLGRKYAARCLVEQIAKPRRTAVQVLDRVGEHFGLSWQELTGKARPPYIANARHVAAWCLRQQGMSYPEIGRALGGRDHTTAMNSVRVIEEARAADPEVRRVLDGMVSG
jgi:chromosomal replication initiation ATPase DnaA